jgi:hypothetical protein
MRSKQQVAAHKKEINKREIMKQFEKLKKFL